jgi:hypothetical protein
MGAVAGLKCGFLSRWEDEGVWIVVMGVLAALVCACWCEVVVYLQLGTLPAAHHVRSWIGGQRGPVEQGTYSGCTACWWD